MAAVIIDGYNLIGTGHRNLEQAREALIQQLLKYRQIKHHDVTVVFDGHKMGPGSERRMVRGLVAIIYSGLGESADDVIKRRIVQEPGHWIVVTSDRAIEQFAWSHGAVPIPSGRFAVILERLQSGEVLPREAGDEMPVSWKEDDEEGERPSRRGGNPHRLSGRDRAIRQALSKL
ncbi:MAG TPA: NYN domain-containing protein [Dissulfurispiraceae bacterium]|nr:NYN domain-containing protein [Dissulfurispiraceae bacterium]